MANTDFPGDTAYAASQYTKERDYWLQKLSGELTKSSFPCDYKRNGGTARHMETKSFGFHDELFSKIMRVTSGLDHRVHMVLTASLMILLKKYTGNDDIIVGTPIGRQKTEGKFINTVLVLRNRLDDGTTFKEFLLNTVRQGIAEANEHQNYPLDALLYQLGMDYSSHDFPLFDVVLLLDNIHDKEYVQATHPNILFSFLRTDDCIKGVLEYNALLYSGPTINRIIEHLNILLQQVITNLDMKLGEIDLLSEAERIRVLSRFNDTKTDYPKHKTIAQLFEEQVKKSPDQVAVVFGGEFLTYRELDHKADRLVAELRRTGVNREDAVAIMAEPSLEMIIGILAILKSGAAYLPLNSDYPEERKNYLLNDGNANIMLTYLKETGQLTPVTIDLDNPGPGSSDSIVKRSHGPGDLAYIMYTSGSTGNPKGTLVEHGNVARLVKNTNYVEFNQGDRLLQTGALEFDASTFEIWGALLNGLTLYLLPKDEILSEETLKKTIGKQGITTMWMTSPLFNQMLDTDIEMFKGLRNLLVGGDVLSPHHINRLRARFPGLNVINGYGPTENTTFSTTFPVDQDYEENLPIGKPIANSSAYIMDPFKRLLPAGVPGELVLGGDGIARGYLNNPQLTAEKFIPSPFTPHPSLIYKTGDLARWMEDGNIEFLGRIDHQIKIRGYRVEPGEIENQLLKLDFIKEAVVIPGEYDGKEKYLCAYLVSGEKIDVSELRRTLLKRLPDYMIPAYFTQLAGIPLTPNGKIDRRALPEPNFQTEGTYAAPRDDIEKTFAGIWSEVLAVDKDVIGIDTDFFELGGHSLKATILISKIQKELHIKIPLAEVFNTPTIRELAQYAREVKKEACGCIEQVEEKEHYPLSSAQRRLYTLQQLKPGLTNYNVPAFLELVGQLQRKRMERSFDQLIQRHDSFRTAFKMINGEVFQEVFETVAFKLEYHDMNGEVGAEAQVLKDFVRPFDLARAPLLRVGLIRLEEQRHILMVDMHHIITDGTSLGIFVGDFMAFYEGKELPALKIQYKDFSRWQEKQVSTGELRKQEAYWHKELDGEVPLPDLPLDYPRPDVQSFEGHLIRFMLEKEETAALKQIAGETDTTLFMLLLAVYNIFLSRLSGQEDIIVGTPIAGRSHPDLHRVIGMFVNTLALRNRINQEETFTAFLETVREKTLAAFQNQDYPFENLVEKKSTSRDVSRHPLFAAAIVLQNMDIPDIKIPGLQLKPVGRETNNSKFDLTLSITEGEETLYSHFEYCTKLFKKSTIERFIGYFKEIVARVINDRWVRLEDIKISSDLYMQKLSVPQDDGEDFGFLNVINL